MSTTTNNEPPEIIHVPNGCGWMIVALILILTLWYWCDMGGRW